MLNDYIEKIIQKNDLSIDESYNVMSQIISGEINNSQISAFLIALKIKGEKSSEIAGFVKAMKEKAIVFDTENAIDICGTGGDSSNTFNISTATAFVVAGAGVKVAKHGNRSVSSQSGSSDVLTELGFNISLSPLESQYAINNIGLGFLFAPNYHPAIKNVMPVRKELGVKTVFNLLGPLLNPANIKKQLIGVYNNDIANLILETLSDLDLSRVCLVCNQDKYDEILLEGKSKVFIYDHNSYIKTLEIDNSFFNYPKVKIKDIVCHNANESAQIIKHILSNSISNSYSYTVLANATFGLFSSGYSESLKECQKAAEDSIISGKAKKIFDNLLEYSRSFN